MLPHQKYLYRIFFPYMIFSLCISNKAADVVFDILTDKSYSFSEDLEPFQISGNHGELDYINNLRNRIAHHEPICFGNPVCIDTSYAHNRYNRIMELFRWMDIDGASLLYGLGHVDNACNQIDALLK